MARVLYLRLDQICICEALTVLVPFWGTDMGHGMGEEGRVHHLFPRFLILEAAACFGAKSNLC